MGKLKVIFIMETLGIGGAEKSLVTILSLIDYEKYDVDLFLFEADGEFMSLLPEKVNLLKCDENYLIFQNNFKVAGLNFLQKQDFRRSYHSIMWLIKCAFIKIFTKKEYIGWGHLRYVFSNIDQKYDVAVGFLEKKSIYYTIDKVKAERKIGFIHNDYSRIPHDLKLDMRYFEKLYCIPTVSEHCKDVLNEYFPYRNKFTVIKNMVPTDVIRNMALEPINYDHNDFVNICTVARLEKQKGIDDAVNVCKKLVNSGFNIRWFVIGEGSERKNLEKLISDFELKENFILLGSNKNPYKFMNFSDIYVQPSRYEGYGITVAEAKVIRKPIVASDIPEFREQIEHLKTGILCSNTDQMVDSIIELVENSRLRETLTENLKFEDNDANLSEIRKIHEILDGVNKE